METSAPFPTDFRSRVFAACRRGMGCKETPRGHWKTTMPIAAQDPGGVRGSTTVDGEVDADVFESVVEQVLTPTLSPGDIVVLENLSSHKRDPTGTNRKSIEKTHHGVWLYRLHVISYNIL